MDRFESMTPEEIAAVIDFTIDKWRDYCFVVVPRMLRFGLVRGIEARGVSPFADATFHFWIRTPDGRVVDPTRWCYEDVTPYIHVGPAGAEYREQRPSEEPSSLERVLGRGMVDNVRLIRCDGIQTKSLHGR